MKYAVIAISAPIQVAETILTVTELMVKKRKLSTDQVF